MILRVILILIAVWVGGYMVLDGSRDLITGNYFGSSLGPWALLVQLAGFDPHHFGAVFVGLGLAWLVALALVLSRSRPALPAAILVGVATFWYMPVGTFLAVVWIGLLVWSRREWRPA
jgi:hypothetical protein